MARQMAIKVEEKAEERGYSPVQAFDDEICSQFRVLSGYDRFFRLVRYRPLKTVRFPANLRLPAEKIGSYHVNRINGF